MTLRIATIADIHHGQPSHTKRGDTALALMSDFAQWANSESPDLVLDLGDRISDVDEETDLRLEAEVAEAFKAVKAPIHHICGNHDRNHLSTAQNEDILGQSLQNELLDCGDWQIALWRADPKITRSPGSYGFSLPETDLLWLSRTLQAAEKPTLIVSHVPVSGHSQIGNYYFERNPEVSRYPESARVRQALSHAKVPAVCISGHVHWNTVTTIDGIAHLTQQSLTESFTTQGAPAGAWGMIALSDTVHWQIFGADPFEARLTPKPGRWTPRLEPF
ncbi:metallophosphoesterase family protein [Pseudohoeflea coraliihabitans]|uniref:Metallophosphoesterase n=1 Tax=Pseudohoeflea coraliihabitans TaxID=2860393 RepID=A0ABS6WP27_9HYPH|nr:metallophosphoesterase [Pseudohoeflea sp. DP4N28-3]MBW3097719.1 metallophosphoesterase [Pseudohoeflea sp. DP4N28-3]